MEAGDGAEPARRLLERYAALYGRDAVDAAGADGPSRLRALERRLARDIRAGAFDDDPAGRPSTSRSTGWRCASNASRRISRARARSRSRGWSEGAARPGGPA